jgi:hypothetical protein
MHGNISIDLKALKALSLINIKSIPRDETYMIDLLDFIEQTLHNFKDLIIRNRKNRLTKVFQASNKINVKSFSDGLIQIFFNNSNIEQLIHNNITGIKRGDMKIYMNMKKPMDVNFVVSIDNPLRKNIEEIEKIESDIRYNKHYVSPNLSSDNNFEDIFKNVSSSNKSSQVSKKGSQHSNKNSKKKSQSSKKSNKDSQGSKGSKKSSKGSKK